MRERVRAATAADAVSLATLETAARAHVFYQRGGAALLAEQPATFDWSAAIDDPQREVLVGTLDDQIFGYLELRFGDATAVVHQVYVDPEARELGLGDWMIEAALSAARARSCRVFEGFALPGDRETKNLFERAGITARKIIVSTRLD
jgi:GNAT superfamily N-acetyltransferase